MQKHVNNVKNGTVKMPFPKKERPEGPLAHSGRFDKPSGQFDELRITDYGKNTTSTVMPQRMDGSESLNLILTV